MSSVASKLTNPEANESIQKSPVKQVRKPRQMSWFQYEPHIFGNGFIFPDPYKPKVRVPAGTIVTYLDMEDEEKKEEPNYNRYRKAVVIHGDESSKHALEAVIARYKLNPSKDLLNGTTNLNFTLSGVPQKRKVEFELSVGEEVKVMLGKMADMCSSFEDLGVINSYDSNKSVIILFNGLESMDVARWQWGQEGVVSTVFRRLLGDNFVQEYMVSDAYKVQNEEPVESVAEEVVGAGR